MEPTSTEPHHETLSEREILESCPPDLLSECIASVANPDKLERMDEEKCENKLREMRRKAAQQISYTTETQPSMVITTFIGEDMETFELYFYYEAMTQFFLAQTEDFREHGQISEEDAAAVNRVMRMMRDRNTVHPDTASESVTSIGPQRLIAWMGGKIKDSDFTRKLDISARVEHDFGIYRGLHRGFVNHAVLVKRKTETDDEFQKRVDKAVTGAGKVARKLDLGCSVEAIPLGQFVLEEQYISSRVEYRSIDHDSAVNRILDRAKVSKEEAAKHLQAETEKIREKNRLLLEAESNSGTFGPKKTT
jgi:hypothetical protein